MQQRNRKMLHERIEKRKSRNKQREVRTGRCSVKVRKPVSFCHGQVKKKKDS